MGPSETIGIVAGGGGLPGEIARSIVARGGAVHIIWVAGSAEDEMTAFPHTIVNWASLGRAVTALRNAGVKRVVFVGKSVRPEWKTAKPDMTFLAALPAVIRLLKSGGDDAVLRGLLGIFESKGFQIAGAGDVAPELLVGTGPLGSLSPGPHDEADIAKGFALVATLGRHDIGQGAIVANGRIEAIEGAEGTDRMIARVREQRKSNGVGATALHHGVLVKRPKPGQDLRVDLPAMSAAGGAGLAGIAVMSGHVLAANRAELNRRADQVRVFVTGIDGSRVAPEDPSVARPRVDLKPLGMRRLSAGQLKDAATGAAILNDMAAFETGSALLVHKGRVLAIGAGDDTPDEVVVRWAQFLRAKSRAAVLVLGVDQPLLGHQVELAAGANVAGFVVFCAQDGRPRATETVMAIANKLGLFVASAAPRDRAKGTA
jgi:DUF1009 family protein